MAVTRADVARLAGTSPALVSYVINGGPRSVAPATRERIVQAIAELGYRPNAVARSLRMARSNTLGLIVPDSANPFFASLSREIEEQAFARGYPLLVGNAASDREREIGYLHTFLDRQVEGLIVIPTLDGDTFVREVEVSPIPVVVLDRVLDGYDLIQVRADDEGGTQMAVEHLISHGHDRIACLSGMDASTADKRADAFQKTLADAGLPAGQVVRSPFGGAAGYAAFSELMAGPDRPTAVFVTSDLQAVGLMRAAQDAGLNVPADLAIVSFDGIEYGAWTNPGLTTVQQPMAELAELAVQLLLPPEGSAPSKGTHSLPTKLLTRGSCGCSELTVRDVEDCGVEA